MVAHLVKKLPVFYGTRGSLTCLDSNLINFNPVHTLKFKICYILSFHPSLFFRIPTSVQWLGYGMEYRVRFPAGHDFSIHQNVQIDSAVHATSYPVSNGFPCSGIKRPWREGSNPLLLVLRLKIIGTIPQFPPYVCILWCLVKHQ